MVCPKPDAVSIADRLWQLLVALETLQRFPADTGPLPPLGATVRSMYLDAIEAGVSTGLVGAAGAAALRSVVDGWSSQSILARELLAATVGDINTLRFDPPALRVAVRLLRRRRFEPPDSGHA